MPFDEQANIFCEIGKVREENLFRHARQWSKMSSFHLPPIFAGCIPNRRVQDDNHEYNFVCWRKDSSRNGAQLRKPVQAVTLSGWSWRRSFRFIFLGDKRCIAIGDRLLYSALY